MELQDFNLCVSKRLILILYQIPIGCYRLAKLQALDLSQVKLSELFLPPSSVRAWTPKYSMVRGSKISLASEAI